MVPPQGQIENVSNPNLRMQILWKRNRGEIVKQRIYKEEKKIADKTSFAKRPVLAQVGRYDYFSLLVSMDQVLSSIFRFIIQRRLMSMSTMLVLSKFDLRISVADIF